jgi:site-specific recombinase XerD
MEIQRAIQEFLEVRELDNCTPKTLQTYEQRLRYFSTWLRSAHGVEEVERLLLSICVSRMKNTPL